MKKRLSILFAAFLTTLVWAAVTQALPSQTFVSSTGNDANDCTQSTPCRTFAGAVPKTSAKGIITALDSSTYGIVTVNKALTLQAAPGVYAGLQGGRADDVVTISAGTTDVVVLRNLSVITQSIAANKGVLINSVGALHVESCIITGFGDSGIFGPSACNDSGCAQLFVIDTILRDNANGLKIGSVSAAIDHCRIEHNHTGILMQAQGVAAIRNSVLSGNSDLGLKASILSEANVENCVVTHNGTGIEGESFGGFFSTIRVSTSMIVSNGTGILPSGGHIISFKNNRLAGNGTNGAFTDTILEQ
jgi:Right handed beta helix region